MLSVDDWSHKVGDGKNNHEMVEMLQKT